MCDSDTNVGVIEDWSITRRWFMSGVMAAGMASGAYAADSVVEMDVQVKTPDGTADAVLFHPPGKGAWPAVLVWPDIFGLRPVFRAMGRRLAAAGYTVLVPNPFYRSANADTIGASVDTSNRDSMSKMFAYRQAMTDAAIDKDAVAYLAFLDSQAVTAKGKKVGVQGYCMGGPLSFRTAAAVPNRIGAVWSVWPRMTMPARRPRRTRSRRLSRLLAARRRSKSMAATMAGAFPAARPIMKPRPSAPGPIS
jgi:carboxymethylenebutenolidase